jgi:hypothetical protein
MATPPTRSMYRTQEELLLDYVRRLEHIRRERRAVMLRLSGLLPFNRREHHLRAAANTFETLIKTLMAQLFSLTSGDIFVVYKKEVQGEVETAIQKVKFLLTDDDARSSRLCAWYNVDAQYQEVLDLARDLVAEGRREQNEQQERRIASEQVSAGEPLTPEILARVEQGLARADLSNHVRRQYACDLTSDEAGPRPVFSELFISIHDLRETLLPGVSLLSNRWLFQHLTETLDRRMLSLLANADTLHVSGEISFNVNIATLLTPEFLAFDDGLPAKRRGGMIVELQKVDVFADLGAYFFAREFVRERGYRLCIDGLTHLTMGMIDRERLGADLVKLVWHPDMVDGGAEMYRRIKALIERAAPSRVILCRCDGREAVDFGRSVGISVFQGRYVEGLIVEENRKRDLMRLKRRGRRI